MNEFLIAELKKMNYSHRDAVVFVRAEGRCEYCNTEMIHDRIAWDAVQFDHIIPKSKGGSDDEENLALACKVCNNAKMTFLPTGSNREERIASAQTHIQNRRKHADMFWKAISDLFKIHGYT